MSHYSSTACLNKSTTTTKITSPTISKQVNLCSYNSPYSLNHVDAMLVFRMLCRMTQSSNVHRTESVSATASRPI